MECGDAGGDEHEGCPRRLIVLGGGAAGVEIAQVVRRLGGEAVVVEGADRVIPREPAPLGKALSEALRQDGIELRLGVPAAEALRDGDDYVVKLSDSTEVRGERLLVATGRRPRVEGIGLETVGIEADPHGIRVDQYLRAADGIWAIGDVNGVWPLTHVGEYEGDVVAANIAERATQQTTVRAPRHLYRPASRRGRHRGAAPFSATIQLSDVPKAATYSHAYAMSQGFLTLLSDGDRLTGAYALGPEAGEWLQQATLAIRARIPVEVLSDTMQPFPSFSGIFDSAYKALLMEIANMPPPSSPMQAQAARP